MTYNQVLKYYGNPRAISSNLDVSRQTPYNWQKYGIPLDAQIKIEGATNGKLRASLPAYVRRVA